MANKWYDNAVMVNRDPNWYGLIDASTKESCVSSLRNHFMQFKGSKVTDVMLGLFESSAITPNSSITWRGEKYLQKVENGIAVDYTSTVGIGAVYKCYEEYHVDALEIFLDSMKASGIRPWFTFRMNDIHFQNHPTSFLHSELLYEEIAAGHTLGKRYPGRENAFDFRYPRYKNALLGYMKELLGKYDVFGIELDFMREPVCFNFLDEPFGIREIMLDYIRNVKKAADEAGKRLGHDVKISIRICRDPDDAYDIGFDIGAMVDEGLIDVVVVTPHFNPTDSCMPIKAWRRLLGDDVAIIAGIETNNVKGTFNTALHSKAYAAGFYAQGADGIYFNNHEYDRPRNREAWQVNRDTCYDGRREFVVTTQDFSLFSTRKYEVLPRVFAGGVTFPLEIGKVKATDKVTLLIDFEGEELPTARIFNVADVEGRVVEPFKDVTWDKKEITLTEHTPVEYDMSGFETESRINLAFKGRGKISYVRLTIDAE